MLASMRRQILVLLALGACGEAAPDDGHLVGVYGRLTPPHTTAAECEAASEWVCFQTVHLCASHAAVRILTDVVWSGRWRLEGSGHVRLFDGHSPDATLTVLPDGSLTDPAQGERPFERVQDRQPECYEAP
jgi:hypothetical protein